jgi:hypothetical protein
MAHDERYEECCSFRHCLALPCRPVITSPKTVTVTAYQYFSFLVTATGSLPITFSTSSELPTGVTLSSTGVLSGTPIKGGTSTITLSATDDTHTGTQILTLTVNPPPLTINYIPVNGFTLNFQGDKTHENVIEYTTDFKQWIPLATKAIGETNLYLVYPQAMDSPYRFYRVIKR